MPKASLGEFRKRVTAIFYELKNNIPSVSAPVIPIYQKGVVVAVLRVVSKESLRKPQEIQAFTSWRQKSNRWFPSQFRVTYSGTKRWSKAQLLDKEDRILFMIEDLKGRKIGHIGFYRFDFKARSCEVDNVIRGVNRIPGVMTAAVGVLCAWGKEILGIKTYYLRVVSHNTKAVALYKRAGFSEVERIPLKKVINNGAVVWEELPSNTNYAAYRFDLRMQWI
jgi:RimJ/RimL family protein N-acetyltransferase